MYPLGHLALGYFAGKITSKITKNETNILLLWIFSMLPDIDILIPGLVHRGPTHSIIVATAIFTPIMIYYKKGTSYYASLLSHSLIGDYITAYGCQLLWPINQTWYKYENALTCTTQMIPLEILLFTIMIGHILIEKYKTTHTPERHRNH